MATILINNINPKLVEKIGTRVIDKPITNQPSFYDNKWENVFFLIQWYKIIISLSLRLEASAILNGFIGLLYKSTASKRNRVKIKQKWKVRKRQEN